MPRRTSYSVIFDGLKAISIADLKANGYLQHGYRKGVLSWTFRGDPSGSVGISIWLDTKQEIGSLQLSYVADGERSIQYSVPMVAKASNLGFGQRWYFHCQLTGKYCSKLHLHNDYFQHRTGIAGGMYETQTRSRNKRKWDAFFDGLDTSWPPHLKTHYRGKATPRFARMYRKFKKMERRSIFF
jgi:hypothetical protein